MGVRSRRWLTCWAALVEEFLHVTLAEGEAVIQPKRLPDDAQGEGGDRSGFRSGSENGLSEMHQTLLRLSVSGSGEQEALGGVHGFSVSRLNRQQVGEASGFPARTSLPHSRPEPVNRQLRLSKHQGCISQRSGTVQVATRGHAPLGSCQTLPALPSQPPTGTIGRRSRSG